MRNKWIIGIIFGGCGLLLAILVALYMLAQQM